MSKTIFALGFLLITSVKADHPIYVDEHEVHPLADVANRNDQQVYRLPQNVIPLDYDIYIDLYFSERTDRPFSFDGKENIIIQVCL